MYKAIVIGASAGGVDAVMRFIGGLKRNFRLPIIITIHLNPDFESNLAKLISNKFGLNCVEIEDKLPIEKNTIYLSPANYHTLIEKEGVFSLGVTDKVSYARPSIDVTFETAADAFRDGLIGILMTGANHDGANGLKKIDVCGGHVIVQSPTDAAVAEMPLSGIEATKTENVYTLNEIINVINGLIERI